MDLRICHYNDGKEKSMSHECYLHDFGDIHSDYNLNHFNLTEITGYGSTQQEALKDLRKQLDFFFKEINAVEKLLMESNLLDDNIVEMDCMGNVIE